MFSMHHDFVPISCSACITTLYSSAIHFRVRPELHFCSCPDCPNSDVTKEMDHDSKCHLQPYKRFVQMAYNCGTPLINILHAQNRIYYK